VLSRRLVRLVVAVAVLAVLPLGLVRAQTPPEKSPDEEEAAVETPELAPPPALGALAGRVLGAVEVRILGDRWTQPVTLRSVRPGDRLTAAVARRAARELVEGGRFARVSIAAEASGDKAVLRLFALPRRLAASVSVEGGKLDEDALLREARISVGAEVTAITLPQMVARARAFYAQRGYPRASVDIDVRETDDPAKVALVVRIDPGPPSKVTRRMFIRDGVRYAPDLALDAELSTLEGTYGVGEGDVVDTDNIALADRALADRLRGAGYHRVRVQHQLVTQGEKTFLYVRIDPGPKFLTRYDGIYRFDADQIDRALDFDKELDKSIRHLAQKVSDFYVRRGFLDVEVDAEERGGESDRIHVLHFDVREHLPIKVTSREFPCLNGGPLSPTEATRDINSFLDEELPGSGLLGAVDPAAVDALHGPTTGTGPRAAPIELEPRATYVEEIYERAQKHLQDYYRSQGYLSATVGPIELVRRQCDRRSPAGQCRPIEPPVTPRSACLFDAEGLPLEEPAPDPRLLCTPDPAKGISCEPRLRIRIPVKLGPRTTLYDVAFEGNKILVEQDLADKAELKLGAPVSQTEIEAARRRIQDAFKEEGFAFADVRAVLDFSTDRTRGRARFVISEGERVYVDGIVVRGAKRTNPSLIMRRVSFERCPRDRRIDDCEPYRASDVRKSEERIATLGTFSSVSISLEDPQVPARRKIVIVEVQERVSQYLDLRPGFSTGEGFRATFEYGHRNLGGEAIQFTIRAQVGYLPDAFIFDDQVKANYRRLDVAERLERRDTISLTFPEVGLGPLIRLGLDGVDVHDIARDFELSKEAAVSTFTYRPSRGLYAQLGGSLERNYATVFDAPTLEAHLAGLPPADQADQSRLLRVPDGLTYAVAERVSINWDRRDNPLGATKGTLAIAGVEHVHAYRPGVVDAGCYVDHPDGLIPANCPSDFLRLTGTLSAYVRLTPEGVAIAVSLRGGRILQLIKNSKTYPDRLFFLGGVDSMRGYLQDSLVPQDVAAKILSGGLDIKDVAIRGGDVFVNPRVELRIPFGGIWEGGLFLDTGNVWVEPKNFDPTILRYAAGAGIRVATPIGPIAFDYGINLLKHFWEDRGNFHFSIGLF
jgi:outer membrane protein insertion porin family